MKFDAIVGNPPYQEVKNSDGRGAESIYYLFIEISRKLAKVSTLIHPARFLFNGGNTPKEWNERMLNDEHFRVVKYWDDSSDVFPTVDIKGGIVVTLYDNGNIFGKIGTFVVYEELHSILDKVKTDDFSSFARIVYPRTLYRFTDNLYKENPWAKERPSKGHLYDMSSNVFDLFPELFFDEKPNDGNDYALIFGRKNNSRILKWIKESYVKVPDNYNFFKVLVTTANGTGAMGETLSSPVIGQPIIGHTETFLSIGKFNTENEAENCMKYIKTKFARTMLGTLKTTQNGTKEVWANIPMQDFTPDSDIDWSGNVAEIDRQLYAKYDLSVEEVAFIEDKVKAME